MGKNCVVSIRVITSYYCNITYILRNIPKLAIILLVGWGFWTLGVCWKCFWKENQKREGFRNKFKTKHSNDDCSHAFGICTSQLAYKKAIKHQALT